jgi:5-bromo-4-chloroindolyl phosphate hydrolysis protein
MFYYLQICNGNIDNRFFKQKSENNIKLAAEFYRILSSSLRARELNQNLKEIAVWANLMLS